MAGVRFSRRTSMLRSQRLFLARTKNLVWGIAGDLRPGISYRNCRSQGIAATLLMVSSMMSEGGLGVPKPGCFKPGCLQYLLLCALLRPFVPFCALLRTCVCVLLRSFAFFCAHLRVSCEQPAFRTTACCGSHSFTTRDPESELAI